jgi:endonuclease YncB( thermonuclease family)
MAAPSFRGIGPLPIVLTVAVLALIAVSLAPRLLPGGRGAAIAGPARVVDGDTLEVAGQKLRIYGVDAPESAQVCRRQGRDYACGHEARRRMQELIDDRPVTCTPRDEDRYGRKVAVCRAGGEDLGAALVRSGWALAYRQYGADYVPQEDEARRRRAGMWAGEFERPSDWRRERRGG